MAIYVTGDTHGNYKRLEHTDRELSEKDYLIIAGDFGFIWENAPDEEEIASLEWFDNRPYTTLFIDGNHENFTRLNSLKRIRKFGGIVGAVSNKVFHLRRGGIYNIDGLSIFTCGGATSIDKISRSLGVSWWEEETSTTEEMRKMDDNLYSVDYKVDVVITHTLPSSLVHFATKWSKDCRQANFLHYLYKNSKLGVNYKRWFAGHFHVDKDITDKNVTLVYKNLLKIKKK